MHLPKVIRNLCWHQCRSTQTWLCWEGDHEWIYWFLHRVVYHSHYGPTQPIKIPRYVIVYFTNSQITEGEKVFPDKPWAWFPIPFDFFSVNNIDVQIVQHLCKYAGPSWLKNHKSSVLDLERTGKSFHNYSIKTHKVSDWYGTGGFLKVNSNKLFAVRIDDINRVTTEDI